MNFCQVHHQLVADDEHCLDDYDPPPGPAERIPCTYIPVTFEEPEEDEHLMSDYDGLYDDYDDDSHLAQYDDDPNPYHGDYCE